jgi:hypothetical protein
MVVLDDGNGKTDYVMSVFEETRQDVEVKKAPVKSKHFTTMFRTFLRFPKNPQFASVGDAINLWRKERVDSIKADWPEGFSREHKQRTLKLDPLLILLKARDFRKELARIFDEEQPQKKNGTSARKRR